jgi:hypothetical protein
MLQKEKSTEIVAPHCIQSEWWNTSSYLYCKQEYILNVIEFHFITTTIRVLPSTIHEREKVSVNTA